MNKFTYNTKLYTFRDIVSNWLETDDLSKLHKIRQYEHFVRENDQSSMWHKIFYEKIRSGISFDKIYMRFLRDVIKPRFGEEIVYQKIPTFRVHFPDNVAVGEWHKDIEYRSEDWVEELNYYVPVTEAKGTSTVHLEGNKSLDTEYGEYWEWDGLNMKHGNVENTSGKTRVSFDFRVHLYQDHYLVDKKAMSINTNIPFTIGGYYEVMDKLGDEREGETITWS